jgi:hypothetical protein
MSDMQAPTIVYGAEGMDETGLIQYQQLTNVLQAGVQATQTFVQYAKDMRAYEKELAETLKRTEIAKFEIGLTAAAAKVAAVEEETGNYDDSPIRSFIDGYEGSEIDEISIAVNRNKENLSNETMRRRAQEEIEAARKRAEAEREEAKTEDLEILGLQEAFSKASAEDDKARESTGKATYAARLKALREYKFSEESQKRNTVLAGLMAGVSRETADIADTDRAMIERAKEEQSKTQAQTNSKIVSSILTYELKQLAGNFESLSFEAQKTVLKAMSSPGSAAKFIIDRVNDSELSATFASLSALDRVTVVNAAVPEISAVLDKGREIEQKTRKRMTVNKLEQFDAFFQSTVINDLVGYWDPAKPLSDIRETYLTNAIGIDPAMNLDEANKRWEDVVRAAAISFETQGSPEEIAVMRDAVETDVYLSAESRKVIKDDLATAMTKAINRRYTPDIDEHIAADDETSLISVYDQIKTDPLVSPEAKTAFETKINEGIKGINGRKFSRAVGDQVRSARARIEERELSELEMLQIKAELFEATEESNKYTDIFGNEQRIHEIPSKFVDDAYADLVKANKDNVSAELAVRIQAIQQKVMDDVLGSIPPADGVGPVRPGKFQPTAIMNELMVLPADSREKAVKNLSSWVQTTYFPAVRNALMAKYGLDSLESPAGGVDPQALKREQANAEFTAMRLFWFSAGGDRDFATSVQQNMFGAIMVPIERTGVTKPLIEALGVYRSASQVGPQKIREFFGNNEQADEYIRILARVDSDVRNGMDINEAFKDATQEYRLDPSRSQVFMQISSGDMLEIQNELSDVIDDWVDQWRGENVAVDAVPIIRHIFLKAALIESMPGSDAQTRINNANAAVEAQLVQVGSSMMPIADINRLNHGPSYVNAAIWTLTGNDKAIAVVVDVQGSEYIYALRNEHGMSIQIRDSIPVIGGQSTFTMSDINQEDVRKIVIQDIPIKAAMDAEAAAKKRKADFEHVYTRPPIPNF